ncbi:MAG: 12-oxophytodienoate reductase [Gammaproteobacteria bacterium]|nr:MAG: 12-oxophytodienoate reductase [Gammaproteobacteria bacterium]
MSSDILFTETNIGKLTLPNRIVMAPMTRNRSPGYTPGEDVAAYYKRRAEGGVGLIITEGTTVNHIAANGYPDVPAFHGQALEGWKHVVDEVHSAGGLIFPQLWHVGSVRKPGIEPHPETPGFSPSGYIKPGKKRCYEMTSKDITDVIEAFAQGAADAQSIGFDGVEFHGAHGYLLDQFFWPGVNHRTDQYGGNVENRTRLVAEIITAARDKVGPDFPLILRFSQWKLQDYDAQLAPTPQELEAFLTPLVDAGIDAFHASQRRYWEPEFEGSSLNLAGWTKKLTGKTAITVGSVSLDSEFTNPKQINANPTGIDNLIQRIEDQEFDLVAVGRALLADPAWAEKIKAEQFDQLIPYTVEAMQSLT